MVKVTRHVDNRQQMIFMLLVMVVVPGVLLAAGVGGWRYVFICYAVMFDILLVSLFLPDWPGNVIHSYIYVCVSPYMLNAFS